MKNGQYLTKTRISEFSHVEFKDLEVPEWGGVIRLRRMDVKDRLGLSESIQKHEDSLMFMVKVVAYTMVDAEGRRIYGDEDLETLLALDLEPIKRIYDASMEFSKLRGEDFEEAVKNSGPSQSAVLPSS